MSAPVMCGAYVARDQEGAVLYVGSSGDIDRRLSEHARVTEWWGDVASIERHAAGSRHMAYDLERDLIFKLTPRHNSVGTTGARSTSRAVGPVVKVHTETLAMVIESHRSVAKLARTVGVDHQTMSNIWRGVAFPSSRVIARLMHVTGLDFDDLFYVETVDGSTSDDWLSRRAPRRTKGAVA